MAEENNGKARSTMERSRELYKYFQPQQYRDRAKTDKLKSPDTVLTSQAQLVAYRLNARRCTVGFLDYDTQYTIAEGTKTLHLDDTTTADDSKDNLWVGVSCLHLSRAGL